MLWWKARFSFFSALLPPSFLKGGALGSASCRFAPAAWLYILDVVHLLADRPSAAAATRGKAPLSAPGWAVLCAELHLMLGLRAAGEVVV